MQMKNGIDLVRTIDPKYIDNIRTLFQGNQITMDIFLRTMQTFVPKKYQTTSQELEALSAAIIDLFEELDADSDGLITWQDFITYYSHSTSELDQQAILTTQKQTVFQNIQQQSDNQSGKTGRIIVESMNDNGGIVQDLPGSRIIEIETVFDTFYIVTDTGLYSYDHSLLFPRKIFEPQLKHVVEKKQEKINQKQYEERLKNSYTQLEQQYNIKSLDFQRDMVVSDDDYQMKHRATLPPTATNTSKIVYSCFISTYNIFAIFLEFPGVFFVHINSQMSKFYSLDYQVCCAHWDSDKNYFYIGHTNGKVTQTQFTYSKPKLFRDQVAVAEVDDNQSINTLKSILARKKLNMNQINKLTQQDYMEIYPELQDCFVKDFGNPGDLVNSIFQNRENLKQKVNKVLLLKEEELQVAGMKSDAIFNLSQSAIKYCGLTEADLIREDPAAFIEVNTATKENITERKHGCQQLFVEFNIVKQKFLADGVIKCIISGTAQFDSQVDRVYRVIIGSLDGTVLVVNEQLTEIASFPGLHEEGILNVHLVDDVITTVGYNSVLQIDSEALQSASQGFTGTDLNLTDKRLMDGDLVKASACVKQIPPPRPGVPITHSFQMGNIIGAIDHEGYMTLFQGKTGAHLSRISCNFSSQALARFGQGCYSQQKNCGYIPLWKQVYFVKAIPNEEIEDDEAIWDVLQLQTQEESTRTASVPIGSINSDCISFCINQAQGEVAIISGQLEITFYSLSTGRPIRTLKMDQLTDDATQQLRTEYTSIETNDTDKFFTTSKRSKSLQQSKMKNPPQILKQNTILELLGQKLLQLSCDIKGRILFAVGSLGTVCFYWNSGQPFNINTVGIIGTKEQLPESGIIPNPITQNSKFLTQKINRTSNLGATKITLDGDLKQFTLNLDFDKLLDKQKFQIIQNKQRQIILVDDKQLKRLYICDSLNSSRIFCISTSSSQEFQNTPVNTRIIKAFDIQRQEVIDSISKLRASTLEYFKLSSTFGGQIDNMFGLTKISNFIPKSFWNQNRLSEYEQRSTGPRNLVSIACGQYEQSEEQVTCIAASNQLGLIAVGTSTGQVQIFDATSSFLPQGVIDHPYVVTRPSITSVCFTGEYPFVVSGNSNGDIFIHTVRPYKPSLEMVAAFRHSNYLPNNRPMDLDYLKASTRFDEFIRFQTLCTYSPTKKYLQHKRKVEDFINFVLLKVQPDIRDDNIVDPNMNATVAQFMSKSQSQFESQNSEASQHTQKFSSTREMNNVVKDRYFEGPRQVFNMPEAKQIEEAKTVTEMNESQSDYQQEFVLFKEFVALISSSKLAFGNASLSFGGEKVFKNQRQRRTSYKISAAVSLVRFAAVFGQLNKPFNRKLTAVVEMAANDPIAIQRNRIKQSAVEAEQIDTSKLDQSIQLKRTNQYLHNRQKMNKKVNVDQNKILPSVEDVSGNSGYVFKQLYNGVQVQNVPVRVEDVSMLKTQAVPTALLFNDQRLIVGDESGFVITYSLEQLFITCGAQPVQKKFHVIKRGDTDEYLDDGFQHQSLQNTNPETDSTQPHYQRQVKIEFGYRATTQSVQLLEKLAGSESMLVCGQDRRMNVFNVRTGALVGSVQRVQLSPPNKFLEDYFRRDLTQNVQQQLLNNASKNLTLNDLKKNDSGQPPFRLEYPPACAYKWEHAAEKSLDMTASAGVTQTEVMQQLVRRNPMPTYEENGASALLKSTGLTPRRLAQHKDSWTVRAILGKATGWKMDSSTYASVDNIVGAFATPQRAPAERKIKFGGVEEMK
ncbi:Conserved_hypothetical protein [Hexamita inflata]|uniref:EF-hand domain-containing protein n=1 Tax=Hexamita inflata TaxID=28002 RepID=A0AA86R3S8_9EUKA|nr:Conserved hypothetical protein [Hexamita inflata]